LASRHNGIRGVIEKKMASRMYLEREREREREREGNRKLEKITY